jgi:putative membrane-bound dehydrogenase-like protein
MRRTAVALLSAFLLPPSAFAQDPALPKCPADWKVEVVAEAPKLVHPSVVCCAPDGRIFVAEDPMDMGNDSRKPTDRILCLHPDGKVTVFAENLHAVFGMQYLDGRLYVHHVPKYSVFTDDNGVGRDRKDLIETTNPNPAPGFNDHIPAQIRPAMDGYFYMAVGDKGVYQCKGPDGRTAEIFGGGLLRMRPDGTGLEVYATGTRNHLDVAVTSEDEMFTYDNTDDGHGWWTRVTHMVDGGFYGYPWDYKPRRPYTLWMITDFKGGSPTGAVAYTEDALPPEYRDNVFLSEWGRSQLIRLRVSRDGGTYKIDERQDILTKGTKEFRPVGLCITPDGLGFYVCDWNYGGWKATAVAGRLLKFTYTGKSHAAPKPGWYVPAAMGKPFEATVDDLVAGLKHPARSVRMVAQRRLAERGGAAVPALTALLADHKSPAHARWHAIWTLDAIDGGKVFRWDALSDPVASVRRQAARQLGTHPPKNANAIEPLLSDADAAVRFQAATALGRVGNAAHVDPLLRALAVEKDFFTRYALFTALHRTGMADPSAWASITRGLKSDNPAVREAVLFSFRDAYVPEAVSALSAFVADGSQPAEVRAAALESLAELHRKAPAWDGRWWGTQPVKSPRPAKTVEWPGTAEVVAAVRTGLNERDPAVRLAAVSAVGTVRDASSLPALKELFAEEGSADVRRAVVRSCGAMKDPVAAELIIAALSDHKADPAVLEEAAAAAGRVGGTPVILALTGLVNAEGVAGGPKVAALESLGSLKAASALPAMAGRLSDADAKVRAAAIAALTAVGGEAATAALIPLLSDTSADIRRSAVVALGTLKNPKAVEPLLQAFADPQTRFEAVSALAATPDVRALDAYLEGLAGKSATVRKACAKAVAAIRDQALPLIEARLDKSGGIPARAVAELQAIYTAPSPIFEWVMAGPFEDDRKDVADPAALKPSALPELKKPDGKPRKWKKVRGNGADGMVDVHKQLGAGFNCYAYAVAEIDLPKAAKGQVFAGADDGIVVWVNGVKVYDNPRPGGGYRADEFKFAAEFAAGRNVIVARVNNSGGGWSFSVAVPTPGAGKLFGTPAAKTADPAEYAAFAAKTDGNAERGRALFADLKGAACLKCHKVGEQGGDAGPALNGIATKYNRAQLIESVLYPSKQILDGYHQTQIRTSDGQVLAGIVRSESPEELVLVDAEGRKHTLKKDEIEARKTSNLSLMPDGLHNGMSREEFADLIAYLSGLKEAAK